MAIIIVFYWTNLTGGNEMPEQNWILSSINLHDQDIDPGDFLGDEDASVEWSRDEKPVNLFLHTETYNSFKEDHFLFLFGRRGTGKTAIIRMLQYEIRANLLKGYNYSWRINSEDAYSNLIDSLKNTIQNSDIDLSTIRDLTKKWIWLFYVSAMEAVILKHYQDVKHDKNYDIILKYLKKQSLIIDDGNEEVKFHHTPIEKITSLLNECLSSVKNNYKEAAAISVLAQLIGHLYTCDFDKAKEALLKIISKNKRCLILIDSIEQYYINNRTSQAITTALIKATYDAYIEASRTGLYIKVAFPSELYTYLSPQNKEKIESKNIFILWSYKDLVSLLAKRYNYMLFNANPNTGSYEDFKEEHPKEFLYQFIPGSVMARNGLNIDTLAYIIRHTQKKPRQVILLMNIIINYAMKKKGESIYSLSTGSIINGVHARLDILAKGALDAYEQIYPNVTLVIQKSLLNSKCYFNYSEFDKLIKESRGIRKEDCLTVNEVKSIFLGTGAVGIICKKHFLKNLNRELWECSFEYQMKDTIAVNNTIQFVVHPMFYSFFKCKVDRDIIIFPQPQENEEKEYLKAQGINII
jgi:hypothetical protein